ncbi:hypothetical protein ABEV34_05050 [Methylorubrum rhodesianum]|uniref:hypothetical protein n=1 Tax=Methylorubrum rhodesianum TaxID=29427 RepID=UPI003D2E3FEE
MAAALDRSAFFNAARAQPFGGSLKQGQVTGMSAILDACPLGLDSDSLAYCLATAFHETARTMLPIKEYGGDAYFKRMYDPKGERPQVAKTLGNTVPGDGAKFAGRGYVQLTGRSNYRRATAELRKRGYLTAGQDLTLAPDMAMTPDIAAAIMFLGMAEGWFTGKKLSDYFGSARVGDPFNARRIINGVDKAEAIKGYHTAFRAALKAAGHVPGAVSSSVPTKPVETGPVFAPAPRKPADPPPPNTGGVSASSSLLSRILLRFSTKA